jgi:2-dehydro-3-deoxyphosphooctonate aldolase (KDO 8-P synthase)
MPTENCTIGRITAGQGQRLLLIAGPCVLEQPSINDQIAESLCGLCQGLNCQFIFKASYDKANRSSIKSARGPGTQQGLDELHRIKQKHGVMVSSDVHEPGQPAIAADVVDLLQVPAFLCRQTDLLCACAETGKAVNVKKGQFLSPAEMRHVIAKLRECGAGNIMLTERGTFFGYNRLVNDFIGLGDLMDLGPPVCFDVTHSTQLPGAGESSTGGRPDRAGLLARAAAASGVHALFVECHPEPRDALSDSATMQPLKLMPELVREVLAIRHALGMP